jgi:phenol 2-monooxygenase
MDFPCTGRFGLLVLTPTDLLDPDGVSAQALNTIESLPARYRPIPLQLTILHNMQDPIRGIAWKGLPRVIHKRAETRFHSGRPGELPDAQVGAAKLRTLGAEDAYRIFRASREQGMVVAVRPDGYVGTVAALEGVKQVTKYLMALCCAGASAPHWTRSVRTVQMDLCVKQESQCACSSQ